MLVESQKVPGVEVRGDWKPEFDEVLTPDAIEFVTALCRRFGDRRLELLRLRQERQSRLNAGELPDFLPETKPIRDRAWTIDPVPTDLQDRRVEITGPAGDRKMVINALNSGAKTFMADFEDANSPTWDNTVLGQVNLRDAVARRIEYQSPEGKRYELRDHVATLIVRPRGWHLEEAHLRVDGRPVSGSLFDFGLYLFHNARALLDNGSGPYYYLPKLESHLEARLWDDVFTFSEAYLRLPHGTIKATVLIETILAAFEMDEILYELRHHAAGLNCGRWDYIFSYIKKTCAQRNVVLPDRALVTMTTPFMRSYSLLTIQTCHRRGAHAIGGMAAQIPIKGDPVANEDAMRKVRSDKEREATDGHDGTWVAHPGLVPVAMEVFDHHMPEANQVGRVRDDIPIGAAQLLQVPVGSITEQGLRTNISVGIQYLAAWLKGSGAVPIFNLMEDAATAEISRTQVWQWIRHEQGVLADGRKITLALVRQFMEEELAKLGNPSEFESAAGVFWSLVSEDQLIEFLTIPGYRMLTEND